MQHTTNVDRNLDMALKHWLCVEKQDFDQPIVPIQIETTSDLSFRVSLSSAPQGFLFRVSIGVGRQIDELLNRAINQSSKERTLRNMIGFVVLHELAHIALGHFEFSNGFGIAHRSTDNQVSFDVKPYDKCLLVPKCLEMQADHEALEELLGTYQEGSAYDVREVASAICGMMVLIELEDTKNGAQGRTHPRAATRIFQLLGHVAEMPLVRAQVHHDTSLIPTGEELQAFARDVTIPCFFDAIQLAQTAGAASIADDLGSPEDFFKDLEIAKLGDPARYVDLKTQGAQECAKLWPCNETLKPILGGHFTN